MWKQIFFILILPSTVIGCGIVAFIILFYAEIMTENNRQLNLDEKEFLLLPHPTNTFKIEFRSMIRGAPANGDSCYYVVGELRRYSGSTRDIENFYADKYVEIEFIESEKSSRGVIYDLDDLSKWSINSSELNSNDIYLVYRLRGNYDESAKIDPRCS